MKILLVAALIACSLSGETVSCPAEIRVDQKIAAPVEGWSASREDIPHHFAAVTFFDGNPSEGASLVYDRRRSLGTKWTATWNFSQDRTYWLRCSYAGTNVVLEKQLAKTLRSCTVTYNGQAQVAGLPEIVAIDCR